MMDGRLTAALSGLLTESPFHGDDYLVARAIDKIKGLQAELKELRALKATVDQAAETIANLKLPKIKPEQPEEPTYKHICLKCMGTGVLFGSRCPCETLPKPETQPPEPPPFDPPKCPQCNGVGFIRETTYSYDCPLCHNPERKLPSPPEPPKKAVYEWTWDSSHPKQTILTLFRNSCAAGKIIATDGSILYFVYPNFIERRNERDTQPYSASSIESAKSAVEAVVRAHYGDEA